MAQPTCCDDTNTMNTSRLLPLATAWLVGLAGSCVILACTFIYAPSAHAHGESINGFPSWSERVLLEWLNRARVDPQADLADCPSGHCSENLGACYTPQPPRVWNEHLAHSSRFHSDEMHRDNFFDHYSQCVLIPTVALLYLSQPQQCDGGAACACVGGTRNLGQYGGTDPFTRMALFGAGQGSEGVIIANAGDPNEAFYAWLYEVSSETPCVDNGHNGHRWMILSSQYGSISAGAGVSGNYFTMNFDDEPALGQQKIPSGAHYPRQASSVDAWANWHDGTGPSVHKINVDGVCSNMSLLRGTQINGAWHASVGNVGSGCHHYVFAFKDSAGHAVLYPSSGALTIGDGSAQCPDFSRAPPPGCAGFDRLFANGFEL